MPPYGLPAGAVVSGIKSHTHKGAGYNEMAMDDTAGKEKITIHAQYDMNTAVEHDQSTTVHNNRTDRIDGTHTETITKDTRITIESGTYSHDVAANTATYHVSGDLAEHYDSRHDQTVKADQTLTLQANRTAGVTGDETLTVQGKLATDVTDEASITSKKKLVLQVGASTVEMVAGSITLTNGPSSIKIDSSGVTIMAPKISLNG